MEHVIIGGVYAQGMIIFGVFFIIGWLIGGSCK